MKDPMFRKITNPVNNPIIATISLKVDSRVLSRFIELTQQINEIKQAFSRENKNKI